ncbi:MAG: hypothetical protein PHU25_12350 [Deltaproteobacteria bacterium]|nr:hypothetical protein [Deltaproteobacteria bacterium]
MNKMRNAAIVVPILSLGLAQACGGSTCQDTIGTEHNCEEYGEAIGMTAFAVTASLIEAARSKDLPARRPDECCVVCDRCSFPCGDVCQPIGSFCARSTGCSCFDSQLPPDQRPPQWDRPCLGEPPSGTETPEALPLVVVP